MRHIKTASVRRSTASCFVFVGLASGCGKLADDCGRTLTCSPTSDVGDAAVLPVLPGPTSGMGKGGPDASAPAPSDGGSLPPSAEAGSDAAVPPATLLGAPCSAAGDLACNAPAQKLALICQGGVWSVQATCSANENCDGATGVCSTILPGCSEGQTRFCEGRVLRECGADLVSATTVEACHVGCVEAAPARCAVATQLVSGAGHACALLDTGGVRCWGANTQGQLGYGRADSAIGDDELPSSLPLVDVGGKAIQLAAGRAHTCALLEGGDVRCWGDNGSGQLGYGHTTTISLASAPAAQPVVNVGPARVAQIAAGGSTTCVVLNGGAVRCWGNNSSGQLGTATTAAIGDNEAPAAGGIASIGGDATKILVGENHVCTVLESGGLRCWGSNAFGQLGTGTSLQISTHANIGDDELPSAPEVPLITVDNSVEPIAVEQIAAGGRHTCALLASGGVRCWGDSRSGQLGWPPQFANGSIGDDDLPTQSPLAEIRANAVRIAAGFEHTCAVLELGAVSCWGNPSSGALGHANQLPALVPVGAPVVSLSAGAGHTCALLDTGAVRCWGDFIDPLSGSSLGSGYGEGVVYGDNEPVSLAGDISLL